MISYWFSRYGHACPAINYFKAGACSCSKSPFSALSLYLNGISFVIWLLYILYLVVCMSWQLYALVSCWLYASDGWPKFQSIFHGLQSIATDDEKHYQCQNIVLNKKKTGPLFLEFSRWIQSLFAPMGDRDIVESADKGMKVFATGQFDFWLV